MTFSIAAADPATGELGVAVASKFLAVGAVVPFCRAGSGAIATQSFVNLRYGPDGIALLEQGFSAAEVVRRLTEADPTPGDRQLGVVAASGDAASFTGPDCFAWAGGVTGPGYAIQGNVLAGAEVVPAMERAWLDASGSFAQRLVAALAAGDAAGGDLRGRQSAALVVRQEGAGYDGGSDLKIELRVEDHEHPVDELARLLGLHSLYWDTTPEAEWVRVDSALALRLRTALRELGHDPGDGDGWDAELERALRFWVELENLEMRWSEGDRIDPVVIDWLLGA